jgi:hypothetical protein
MKSQRHTILRQLQRKHKSGIEPGTSERQAGMIFSDIVILRTYKVLLFSITADVTLSNIRGYITLVSVTPTQTSMRNLCQSSGDYVNELRNCPFFHVILLLNASCLYRILKFILLC